jgi:Putative transposase DNA-binding domain
MDMIRTRIVLRRLSRATCDALNAAGGAISTGIAVWHWRTYRRKGHWLSEYAARRPSCRGRHKPKGRRYRCPACGFPAHRDVVGQVNILSRFQHGEPGKIPAPAVVKYRIPHNVRVLRRCPDTGQALAPVARSQLREAAGLWTGRRVTRDCLSRARNRN